MGRRNWKRKDELGYFIPISWKMVDSDAFKELTNASRTAYLIIKRQYNKDIPGQFKCPYSTAEQYMERHTFARSIKQLIELGFIKKSQKGSLYRKTNIYSCSEDWGSYKRPQI